MEIKIYYEDTDCGGVVYYANYLKYFERARTHYLEDARISVVGLMAEGTIFVVVHAEVDYWSPARYGETLVIETVVSEMTAASFTFAHVVRTKSTAACRDKARLGLAATDGNDKVKRLDKATVARYSRHPILPKDVIRKLQCVEPAAVRCFPSRTNDGSRIALSGNRPITSGRLDPALLSSDLDTMPCL